MENGLFERVCGSSQRGLAPSSISELARTLALASGNIYKSRGRSRSFVLSGADCANADQQRNGDRVQRAGRNQGGWQRLRPRCPTLLTKPSRAAKISIPFVPQMGYAFAMKFWLKLRFVPGRRLPLHARDRSGIWSYRLTRHLLRLKGASGALWCQILRLGAARVGCVYRSPRLGLIVPLESAKRYRTRHSLEAPDAPQSPARGCGASCQRLAVLPRTVGWAAADRVIFPEEKRCRERRRRFRAHPCVVA